jgi:tRNA(fMet)-specific endonuclease VapC
VTWLLDTNTVIALLKGDDEVWARVDESPPDACVLPSVVMYELYYGASKSQRREANLDRIEKLRFAVLDFDREDARAAGEIRARLEIAGTPIGAYDILIAGQALSRGFILITRNVREFERVEGLKLERW